MKLSYDHFLEEFLMRPRGCSPSLFTICVVSVAIAISFFLVPDQRTAEATETAARSVAPAASESSVLAYTASPAPLGEENQFTLRLHGANLELSDSHSGSILRSRPLAATQGVEVQGADGETNDMLTVDFSGGPFSLPAGIRYDGGVGGYDTLVITGGTSAYEIYDPKNQNDGVITLDGLRIIYSNIEPITDVAPVTNYTIDATATDDLINIIDGGVFSGDTLTQVNSSNSPSPTFESISFANKTNVIVNGKGGSDTITLNNPNPATGLATLTINGGNGSNSYIVTASPPSVTVNINGGAGDDTLTVNDRAGLLDNLRYVPTGPGAGQVINDTAGVPVVNNFTGVEHLQLVVTPGDGDGVRIDGTIGNDQIQFFHGAIPGVGRFTGIMDQNNATGVGPFALTEMIFQGTNPAANDADVNFFNPGGVDTFVFNGTTGDDVIAIGAGEAGGTEFRNTIGGTLFSRLEVFNVASATVNGDTGSDTFNVTPRSTVTLNINGGAPTPPALPGDVLAIDTTGTTNPVLHSTNTPTGLQGSITFGDREPVNFEQIESIRGIAPPLHVPMCDPLGLALLSLGLAASAWFAMRRKN